MGVFEKLPYLNYHDINLDWLVRQTKKNASDNSYLMKIFKWFQDQGLVGTITNVTENPDDTVKIDYADFETQTMDDFTVYDKNGVDGLVSGLSGRIDDNDTDIGNLQGDVTGLDTRLGTAEGNITNLQKQLQVITLDAGDTIQGTVNAMPDNSRCMIIQNGLAISDAPITGSTYFIYTVDKGASNRIFIEATVNGGGIAYEHYFAVYSGSGPITWRRYVETPSSFVMNPLTTSAGSNSFNIANGSRHLVAVADSNDTRNGLYLVYSTGSGYVSAVPVLAASGLTITTSTNTLTIDTGTGTPVIMDFWIGTMMTKI